MRESVIQRKPVAVSEPTKPPAGRTCMQCHDLLEADYPYAVCVRCDRQNAVDVDGDNEPSCPSCGGEGMVEYLDAGPSAWGEDCPSEENHMVKCPNCRGSGLMKDATSC